MCVGVHFTQLLCLTCNEEEIEELLEQAGLPRVGKANLRDGRTGEYFDSPVTVGYAYMMKFCTW